MVLAVSDVGGVPRGRRSMDLRSEEGCPGFHHRRHFEFPFGFLISRTGLLFFYDSDVGDSSGRVLALVILFEILDHVPEGI